MAASSPGVIEIIRKTAYAIAQSQAYQWGHMGLCNCGFLARQITRLKKEEIHTRAMQGQGDWSEQLNDYCPSSGLPMDNLIAEILHFGFDADDLKHLERLSDPAVLCRLPGHKRHLSYNVQADVVTYLHTWASMLEENLIRQVRLPHLESAAVPA